MFDCHPHCWLWSVSNGDDALAFLRHAPPFLRAPAPTLILLDLNLPPLRGEEVLTRLRTFSAYQTTPVIIVTGEGRAEHEARCLQLGANAYVEKSWNFETSFASLKGIFQEWLGIECTPA